MTKHNLFDEPTTRYFNGLSRGQHSTGLPKMVESVNPGRPYVAPEIGQFRILRKLKARALFWKR